MEEINFKYPKALEEYTSRTLKQLPKITVTEESPTPRKFFKSKDKTNLENSPPDFRTPKLPASAVKKGARSSSKSVKKDLSSMEPKEAKSKQPVKSLKSIGSFAIYDDSQCKTPLKDQGNDELARSASRGRAGARSSKKALVESEELKTPVPSSGQRTSPRLSARKKASSSPSKEEERSPSLSARRATARSSSRKSKSPNVEELLPSDQTPRSTARKTKSQAQEAKSSEENLPTSVRKSTRKVKEDVTATRSSSRALRRL